MQRYDRYAYVNNSPVRYNDPSGHWVFETDDPVEEQRRNAIQDAAERVERNRIEINDGNGNIVASTPKPSLLATRDVRILTLPQPTSANNHSWIESMLASKEMPLAMAAIQVLTVDGIPLAIGITAGIGPDDLPITLGLFTLSRGAAILGTAATFYQYSHGLNETQLTDVGVSAGTTIAGFFPSATVPSVHINLFYSAYRYWDGELPNCLP